MRTLLAVAAAIAALGTGAALAVWRLTAPPPGAPAPASPAVDAGPGGGAAPPASTTGFDPFAPGGLQAPPVGPAPPETFTAGSAPDLAVTGTQLPAVPAKEPWVSVPLRPRDLRTLWTEISRLRPDLPGCWADEPRAALRPSGGAKGQSAPAGTPGALILVIDSEAGRLRIADTIVDTLGDDRRTTVECARGQLKGLAFSVPSTLAGSPLASPGTRARMRFVLQ